MTAVVTGANRGIGLEIVRGLAHRGIGVVMLCRDPERGRAALEVVRDETGSERLELVVADLSSLEATRAAAAEVASRHERLGALVNNHDGIFETRETSPDGLEMNFALNYLAYFHLATLLRGPLERGRGRVVNVAAEIHRGSPIDLDALGLEHDYDPITAFRRSKFAVVAFTHELARRAAGTGVTANSLHPGSVETASLRRLRAIDGARTGRDPSDYPAVGTPEQGARLPIRLAAAPELEGVSGAYFVDDAPVRADPGTYDPELCARLWTVSEELIG